MRSSRTREPLLLNKHESSRLIYRFTRPLVVTYFLTDGLSHNNVTQVIKACVLESWDIRFRSIVFQCSLFSKSNACDWNRLQVKACSCWWLSLFSSTVVIKTAAAVQKWISLQPGREATPVETWSSPSWTTVLRGTIRTWRRIMWDYLDRLLL